MLRWKQGECVDVPMLKTIVVHDGNMTDRGQTLEQMCQNEYSKLVITATAIFRGEPFFL